LFLCSFLYQAREDDGGDGGDGGDDTVAAVRRAGKAELLFLQVGVFF
jgi:hypothetical protein